MNNWPESISVTELKAVLLEIIRRVERGHSFKVTKGNRVVAFLGPAEREDIPVVGFAEGGLLSDSLELPAEDWSFDLENIGSGFKSAAVQEGGRQRAYGGRKKKRSK